MYYEVSITDPDEGMGAFFAFSEIFAAHAVNDEREPMDIFRQALYAAIADYDFVVSMFPRFADEEYDYDVSG